MEIRKMLKLAMCLTALCCFALLSEARQGATVVKHTVLGGTVKGHGRVEMLPYHRLLSYGKSWIVEDSTGTEQRYYLSGDTVIGGWPGLKLYLNAPDGPVYQGTLCEEELQTGIILPGEQEPWLMYDFGMRDGDAAWIYNPLKDDSEEMEYFYLHYENDGTKDVMTICGRPTAVKHDSLTMFLWKEGIGSIYGILSPYNIADKSFLVACYDGEKCLYKQGHLLNNALPDSIGFLRLKEVSDIATFNRLMNGVESTLTLSGDTVYSVKDGVVCIRNGTLLVLYQMGLDLHPGDVLKGTLTGRKEWRDGRPVMVATENTSSASFSCTRLSTGISPQPCTPSGVGPAPRRLDGIRASGRGIVIRNGRKVLIR